MKKAFGLILAAAMILCLVSSAAAEEDNNNHREVKGLVTKEDIVLSEVEKVADLTYTWEQSDGAYLLKPPAPESIVWDPVQLKYTSSAGSTLTNTQPAAVKVTVTNRGNIAYTASSAFEFVTGFTGTASGIDAETKDLASAAEGITDLVTVGIEKEVSFTGSVSLTGLPDNFSSFGTSARIGTCTVTLTPKN